ncbi:MAG: type II toxin-antitoxin system VapC family toxin [Alphaproteobacteria bacterium]|nr:type II toxin-antitoxin system VapC family toxin [Alphaproteobacteria bacterium]
MPKPPTVEQRDPIDVPVCAPQCGWVKGRDYDRMIAAHAISGGFVLVTHNDTDFRDIPELAVENWIVDL